MNREIYNSIIISFLEIPILTQEHQLPKPFEECSDEELSDYITTMVIPHTIAFFSQMVYCNKDYRDVVQNIINNLAKSKSHFLYFQNILKQLP